MRTKSEYFNLYLFELETLSKHFEEMAQQGWMLSNICSYKITYQECEPQRVHYSIDIYHKGGYLNPSIISSDEIAYADFISEYGYEFVTRTSNFQVFLSHQENIIPIHNDHEETRKAQRKTIFKYELCNHLILLLFIPIPLSNYTSFRLYTFTSNLTILLYTILPFMFVFVLYRLYPTFKWLLLKENYHISVTSMMKRNKTINHLSILLVIFSTATLFISGTNIMIPMFLTLLISAASFFLLDPILARFIKKYHSVVALVICIYIGMFININFFIFSVSLEPSNQSTGELSYQDIRSDLPDVVDRNLTRRESFILKQEWYSEYYQDNQNQERDFEKDINFHYELYTIAFPLMTEYLQDIALDNEYTLLTTGELPHLNSDWKLYQSSYNQCLMWDNYILYINLEEALTPTQINLIISKL